MHQLVHFKMLHGPEPLRAAIFGCSKGGRNQADISGRELGTELLTSTTCCKSCTRTASTNKSSGQTPKIKHENLTRGDTPLVFLKSAQLAIQFFIARKSAMILFLRVFASNLFTNTNSVFCLWFCGGSTLDSGSCKETSLCRQFNSNAESCESRVANVMPFFRLPRTGVVEGETK